MKNKILLGSLIVVWSTFFFTTIVSALPYTPLNLSENTKEKVLTHVLQGWGFFSKNPRDEMFNVHLLENEDALLWPNITVDNLFGLSREGHAQGVEAGRLYSQIPDPQLETCERDIKNCLESMEVSATVKNEDNKKTICGPVGFSFTRPVPWAWSDYYSIADQESQVVKVKVLCE